MGRAKFEKELKELYNEIIEMGSFVETAIENSIKAFESNDLSLCQSIIENDMLINKMEKNIESKCLWLIAREQPIASDLRQITTALKIISDMERIGDHAAEIAKLSKGIIDKNSFTNSSHLLQMAATAVEMVGNSITAYINSDLALARDTRDKDDIVDEYFRLIKHELVDVFSAQPQHLDNAIDFLLIVKYLERIGDHAVSICEWVHFSQTGEHKNTLIF